MKGYTNCRLLHQRHNWLTIFSQNSESWGEDNYPNLAFLSSSHIKKEKLYVRLLRSDSSLPLNPLSAAAGWQPEPAATGSYAVLLLWGHCLFRRPPFTQQLKPSIQLSMAMRMASAYHTNPYATARWDLSCCDASIHTWAQQLQEQNDLINVWWSLATQHIPSEIAHRCNHQYPCVTRYSQRQPPLPSLCVFSCAVFQHSVLEGVTLITTLWRCVKEK